MLWGKPIRTWLAKRRFAKRRLEFGVVVISFLLVLVALAPLMLVTIPPGSVGVLWLRLFGGTVFNFHFGEGLKVILPWDRVHVYDARLRRLDLTVTALSGDGLEVETEITVQYRLNPNTVPDLYDFVGPNYEIRLLEPSVTSAVTSAIVARNAVDLYILAYDELESSVAADVRKKLESIALRRRSNGDLLTVEAFTMRRVILPQSLQDAISSKLSAQQVVSEYQYIIQRERQESERKAIEAEGIRRFQEIISSSISDSYLRWRGIDATLRLAESPNSKIVVIGNGVGGMPLILGGLDDTRTSSASSAPQRPNIPMDVPPIPSPASSEGSSPALQPPVKSSDSPPLPRAVMPPLEAGKLQAHP